MEYKNESDSINKITITTLEDLPVSSDDFGGHQKVADSIEQMILTENGGKSIALEGHWGTGKSSIVAMLEMNLKRKGVDTIVFDAWAHQGDPLRRVFLERLTGLCFKDFEMERRREWIERKEKEITGKTKTTTTKSTPVLRSNKPIKFLAAASLLPPAFLILTFLIRLGEWNWTIFALQIVTLLIVLLPSIILLSWAVKCNDDSEEKLQKVSEYIALWKKKIDDNTVSLVSESLEPSTVEFQSFFGDLMEEYLKEQDRKILIVLDNLDRVSRSDALNLWSTLRLFAETCEKSEGLWSKRVWFLVPYDLPSASKVWSGGAPSLSFDLDGASSHNLKLTDESNDNDSAAAFFDKTFQIRFSVPPLHLTDWKRYLEELLARAFGKGTLDETRLQLIYRIAEGLAGDSTPTPRLLKLFVNDLGALARQFYGDFPIDHLAIFTVLRRQRIDIREWILSGAYKSHPSNWIFDGEDYLTSLLSIYFGTTDHKRAQVLLFRNPLETALTKGNPKALSDLSDIHGFWDASEKYIRDELFINNLSQNAFCQSAKALDKSNLFGRAPSHYHSAVVQLSKRMLRMVKLDKLDEASGLSASFFLGVADDENATNEFISKFTRVVRSEDSSFSVESWLKGWIPMQSKANELKHDFETILPESDSDILYVLSEIREVELSGLSIKSLQLPNGKNHEDLTQALIGDPEKVWSDKCSRACLTVNEFDLFGVDLASVIESFSARFDDPGTETEEANRLFRTLLSLSNNYLEDVIESLREFVEDGDSLVNQISERHSNASGFEEILIASFVSAAEISLPSDPAARKPYNPLVNAVSDQDSIMEIARGVVDILKDYPDIPWLESVFINSSLGEKIGVAVVICASECSDFSSFFRNVGFSSTVTTYCEHLSDSELRQVYTRIVETGLPYEVIQSLVISEDSFWIHKSLIKAGATKVNDYTRILEDYFASVSVEQWLDALSNENEELELFASFVTAEEEYQLPINFIEALESFGRNTLKSDEEVEWDYESNEWKQIVDRIPVHRRSTIHGRIIDDIFNGNPKNLFVVIRLFGDDLGVRYAESEHESLVRRVAEPIVNSNEVTAINWLENATRRSLKFWNNSDSDDRKTFAETLVQKIRQNETDESICSKLKLVARNLDIDFEVESSDEVECENA